MRGLPDVSDATRRPRYRTTQVQAGEQAITAAALPSLTAKPSTPTHDS
jgi:hypothetical protein